MSWVASSLSDVNACDRGRALCHPSFVPGRAELEGPPEIHDGAIATVTDHNRNGNGNGNGNGNRNGNRNGNGNRNRNGNGNGNGNGNRTVSGIGFNNT